MRAFETTGKIDKKHNSIKLDTPLPKDLKNIARLIVLFPEQEDNISNDEWLQSVAKNDIFNMLNAPEEDIYSSEDGKPFHAEK